MDYKVDLRDVRFQLFEWLELEKHLGAGHFGDWDRESVELALEEALKIAQEQMATANEEGDRVGVAWNDGRVSVAPAFAPAFRTVAEGGWIGSSSSPEYGGLGLPHSASTAIAEFFAGANLSLTHVFMLTRGAAEVIQHFGTDEMRELFCRKLFAGEWTGTMCLTEPHAGSDVGASTTRAEKKENGRYSISGEKIFITWGDHDLTDNVIHTVLARLPDAPPGTKGLSLFVVPKVRVREDGSLGEPNDVRCAGVEHKMGIHGSPTCSMLFGANGGCEGFLVGSENGGMKLMFHLMNAARLEVGLQGLAVGAAANQAALSFAHERIQSRHWTRQADKSAPPVAIVEHPDVRRMLLTSSAYVEAMRSLLLQTAALIDLTRIAEGEESARCHSYVDLLTPVCKAWASDWSFRVTEWSLQVYGGYGYTQDYPAEQYLRDAKIGSIYEGTNGIQALDLVARKIPSQEGRPFRELLGRIGSTVQKLRQDPQLAGPAMHLEGALSALTEVAKDVPKRPDGSLVMLLNAVPVLDMLGHTLAGSFLLEQALLARNSLSGLLETKGIHAGDREQYEALMSSDRDAAFYHNKIQTAIHFAYRGLPMVRALAVAVESGEKTPIEAVFQKG